MAKFRLLIAGLCLNLVLSMSVIPSAAVSATLIHIAPSESPATSTATGPFETDDLFNSDLLSGSEVIEAPAGSTVYISLGGAGHALLASGARAKFAIATPRASQTPNSLLAADVISGDVIIKLQPQAGALVRAAGTSFVARRGAYFHAAVKDGKAVFDASENVESKLGNWAIKVPGDMLASEKSIEGSIGSIAKTAVREKQPQPLRLNLVASVKPIGSVESLSAFTLDSRLSHSGSLLWGNELIQAPAGMSARASLERIGDVTLNRGSQARLTATTVNGQPQNRVLAASLLDGGMVVKLLPGVSACVKASGSTFVAARGSRFRVMIVEGRALIDSASGDVLNLGDWHLAVPSSFPELTRPPGQVGAQAAQRQYLIRPVGLSSNLVVKARSTRQIQVRVTDENDRPIPDVPVIFLLSSSGGKSIGALGSAAAASTNAKVFTDASGIATVDYRAGDEATTGTISATVEGTNATWVGQISLLKVVPGFWAPQNAIPIIATAAAGVAIGVTKAVTKDEPLPVRASGPSVIRP
jgi:hypothetical protein